MRTLDRLTINNFKSIREADIQFRRLNVFLGANGAGKSNLIGVFHLLNRIVQGELQIYSAGRADTLLHFGRKTSERMELKALITEGIHHNRYEVVLRPTEDDRLVLGREVICYEKDRERDKRAYSKEQVLSTGSLESALRTRQSGDRPRGIADFVYKVLLSWKIYHFHDTSPEARVKKAADVDDNRFLQPDARNLAAFLYWMQEKQHDYFVQIERTIRLIAPYFGGFRLDPSRLTPDKIKLEWKEKGNDAYFDAHALSDGTLRFICLATLLLQPDLPQVILLDEPELGLHPAAITLLAELLRLAAEKTQVILATQSVPLVNQFTPDDIFVVDREDGQSVFRHLGSIDLGHWLEDYSLGELWEKNVFGGRP